MNDIAYIKCDMFPVSSYTCIMCNQLNHYYSNENKFSIPYDCRPISSLIEDPSGYHTVCKTCYDKWDAWDNKQIEKALTILE